MEPDGNEFIECTFNNCNFIYRGGQLPALSQCVLSGLSGQAFIFENEARKTLQFLRLCYHSEFRPIVEEILTRIRTEQPRPGRWTIH